MFYKQLKTLLQIRSTQKYEAIYVFFCINVCTYLRLMGNDRMTFLLHFWHIFARLWEFWCHCRNREQGRGHGRGREGTGSSRELFPPEVPSLPAPVPGTSARSRFYYIRFLLDQKKTRYHAN